MPNWCFTDYHFYGEENEVKQLYDLIKKSTEKNLSDVTLDNGLVVQKNDFRERWLGNCLYLAGIDACAVDESGAYVLFCRGDIVDVGGFGKRDGGLWGFEVTTETAWEPMPKMWQAIIGKMGLTSVKFSFCAEEPGEDLFLIYDPNDFIGYEDVLIDCWDADDISSDLKRLMKQLGADGQGTMYTYYSVLERAIEDAIPNGKEEPVADIVDRLNRENDNARITLATYIDDGCDFN